MGYTIDPATVEGHLFRSDTGKWKYEIAINMREFFYDLNINECVRRAAQATPAEIRGVIDSAVANGSGYILVVLEPYHKYSHPVMVFL